MKRTSKRPVADLHCDLLAYLAARDGRSVSDTRSRCSLPQLRAGGVRLQVMAIFTVTGPEAILSAARQANVFAVLERTHGDAFRRVRDARDIEQCRHDGGDRVAVLAAVENASGVCDENEPWPDGLCRLQALARQAGPLAYVSLTWNDENRFGGGNASPAGLKDDGRRLLDALDGTGTAVDLSHASDRLAEEVLRHLDRAALDVPVLASHSDYRELCEHPRNLPPAITSEIVARGGIVGVNFMAPFAGRGDAANLLRQIEHGLACGDGRHVAFGADFYCSDDLPPGVRDKRMRAPFFEEWADASAYPAVLDALARRGALRREAIERVAWDNAAGFLARNLAVARAG